MPKMTVRVILKSGVEFFIKCDKFTLTRNGFQQVTGYNIEGITENKPVYLDFEQVAAVGNNHVLADHILPIIYTVLVVDLLHPERDKYGGFSRKHLCNARFAKVKTVMRGYMRTNRTRNISYIARSAALKRRTPSPARRRR